MALLAVDHAASADAVVVHVKGAVDSGTVYVLDRITASILYRLDSGSGEFNTWPCKR